MSKSQSCSSIFPKYKHLSNFECLALNHIYIIVWISVVKSLLMLPCPRGILYNDKQVIWCLKPLTIKTNK